MTQAAQTTEDIYQLIRHLNVTERLRLVARIARDLAQNPSDSSFEQDGKEEPDWSQLAGIAPGLLDGNDAQQWVSQERRASDNLRAEGRAEP